jgi:ABC-type branched-subunit amino acid transport system substrate-binding protein
MRRISLVLALATAGCAPAAGDLVIGAIYPTGGSQGVGGIEEYRGVQLATELANREGGVGGRRVRLHLVPTESAEGAPGAIRTLADAGVGVVLGSYGSTISRPAAEAAARQDMVFWEAGAVGQMGAAAAPGDRFFRVAPTGASLGRSAVRFVQDRLAPKLDAPSDLRYAVAYVDDVYGRSVGLGAIEEIRRSGLTLAAAMPYDLASVDHDAQAARIEEAGADVLVVAAYLDDGIGLRRAILRRGVELTASIGTSSSYCMREFGRALGADAVGLFASDKPAAAYVDPAAISGPARDALVWARDTYRQRHDDDMTAPALAGFAGAWALLEHVLPAAGGDDPGAVAAAARDISLPMGALPNGSGLAFAPPGHPEPGANLRAAGVIWEWVEPNTREVVWPPSLATAPILAVRP